MTSPVDVHRSLLAIDTHIDIPWPDGPDPFDETRRRVDLPKMLRGGIAAGCFAAYVPQAPRTAENDQVAFARVLAMLETIRGMARSERGLTMVLATTADEIETAWRDGLVSVMPAVENGFSVGSDLSRLSRFRALGARYLTLTHNGHNALADSAQARADFGDAEAEHGGVSALGRTAIAELKSAGHAGRCRACFPRRHDAGRRVLAHPDRLHSFLHPRPVRPSAQSR